MNTKIRTMEDMADQDEFMEVALNPYARLAAVVFVSFGIFFVPYVLGIILAIGWNYTLPWSWDNSITVFKIWLPFALFWLFLARWVYFSLHSRLVELIFVLMFAVLWFFSLITALMTVIGTIVAAIGAAKWLFDKIWGDPEPL